MLRVHRDRSRRGAVLDAEFRVDLLEVLVDGARAQAQNLRDVAVGLALGQPRQHFALARRQAKLAGEFRRRLGAGILGKPQQEFVRAKLAHILQPKLLVAGECGHECSL